MLNHTIIEYIESSFTLPLFDLLLFKIRAAPLAALDLKRPLTSVFIVSTNLNVQPPCVGT